jgi:hypothetical protein
MKKASHKFFMKKNYEQCAKILENRTWLKNKIILKLSRGLAYLKINVEILKYLERGCQTIFPQEINYFDKICRT